jgi:hypothetical protein
MYFWRGRPPAENWKMNGVRCLMVMSTGGGHSPSECAGALSSCGQRHAVYTDAGVR